jgi:hypothetical protein
MRKESTAMDQNRVARAIKEVKGAPEDAIGWAVSDGVGDKVVDNIRNYTSGLSEAMRDAEAMKSAGLLVAGPIRWDAEP